MDQERRERYGKGAAFILLITVSFTLGYLFARQTSIAPIIIEKCSQ